jgi:hypothetical protein
MIIVIILGEVYRLRSSSLRRFLQLIITVPQVYVLETEKLIKCHRINEKLG